MRDEPEVKYPAAHDQTILPGWASEVNEYCWASALGTKVKIWKQLGCDFWPWEAYSLTEEVDIKVIRCNMPWNMQLWDHSPTWLEYRGDKCLILSSWARHWRRVYRGKDTWAEKFEGTARLAMSTWIVGRSKGLESSPLNWEKQPFLWAAHKMPCQTTREELSCLGVSTKQRGFS